MAYHDENIFDITQAELDGANRGQRPDLLSDPKAVYRTGSGALYYNSGDVLTRSGRSPAMLSRNAHGGLALPKAETPATGYPVLADIRAAAQLSVVNGVVTDVTRVAPDGTLIRGVRLTSDGSSTQVSMDLAFRGTTLASGRVGLLLYQDHEGMQAAPNLAWSLSDGSGFANWYTVNTTMGPAGWACVSPGGVASAAPTKWGVGAGAPSFGTTVFSRTRLRLNHTIGDRAWIEIYELNVAQDVQRSNVAITVDDGYDTAYTLGAPALERYGMRGSFAIIADQIGLAGYMTVSQLQDLVARGHECVVHGPIGGAGGLSNYSASPDRYASVLADVLYHQQFLIANGLARNGSERCYIYPQGYYQFSVGDKTISSALAAANMVGGRAASSGAQVKRNLRGSTPTLMPIVGHLWTSDPAEAANITAIRSSLNTAATEKADAVLMLHRFVTNPAAISLEIQLSNLELILQTLADNTLAGTQEVVLFSKLAHSHAAQAQPND